MNLTQDCTTDNIYPIDVISQVSLMRMITPNRCFTAILPPDALCADSHINIFHTIYKTIGIISMFQQTA